MYSIENWELIKGARPVLLVAGHNAPQIRNGQIKRRDWGTGSLVKYLCEQTGAWGIVATEEQLDPNYHEEAPLRKEVLRLVGDKAIKLVVDIHGRRMNYPRLVEFRINKYFDKGRLAGEEVAGAENLKQNLLIKAVDVPAVEVEIRRDGRTYGDPNFEIVLNKFKKLIAMVK